MLKTTPEKDVRSVTTLQLYSSFYLKHQKEATRAQATHTSLIASVIWHLHQKNNSLLRRRNEIFFPVVVVLTRGDIEDCLIC